MKKDIFISGMHNMRRKRITHLIMISFSLNGTYYIGSFRTTSEGSKVKVWAVWLYPWLFTSGYFKDIFPLTTIDASSNVSQLEILSYRKATAIHEVIFSTLQCDLLRRQRTELCNIATEHGHVLFLLQYIRQTINILAKHHKTITSLSKQNATKISDLLLSRNGKWIGSKTSCSFVTDIFLKR